MKYLTFFLLTLSFISLKSQSLEKSDYIKEKGKIFIAIFESQQFRDIYKDSIIYIESNDIISQKDNLKGINAVLISNPNEFDNLNYIVIGDFTVDEKNLKTARVQIEIFPINILLNFRLIKSDENWIIANFCSFLQDN